MQNGFGSSTLALLLIACSGTEQAARPLVGDAAPAPDASDGSTGVPVGDASIQDAPTATNSPCATDMAHVLVSAASVCVDLYEGALVLVGPDGGETPWPWYEPVDGKDGGGFRAVPAHGIFPQGYISNVEAAAACKASGKRLCTASEWTAACRGQPLHDYVYPYGDTFESGFCNEGDESPIVRLFGGDASYGNSELNDPRCDQLDGGLARGGSYSKCVSSYGAFDMSGNIHEWIDETNPSGTGTFMGGYFVDATENGPGCEYRTTAHAKTYHDYSTGFRCCADPT